MKDDPIIVHSVWKLAHETFEQCLWRYCQHHQCRDLIMQQFYERVRDGDAPEKAIYEVACRWKITDNDMIH